MIKTGRKEIGKKLLLYGGAVFLFIWVAKQVPMMIFRAPNKYEIHQ